MTSDNRTSASGPGPASQTLSRGIRILEILAQTRGDLSIDDVAHQLEVHRSIAYRLLRTLEDHGLVVRHLSGRVALGPATAALAAGVAPDLQAVARPELTAAADELGMTCFLSVFDRSECVTLVSVEPRDAVATMAQRPGTRHPVTVGAPGKAILSLIPPVEWPGAVSDGLRAELREVEARGYATSHDEVISSVQSVAVPLAVRDRLPAAVAVVYVAAVRDTDAIAARLTRAAAAIRNALGG